MRRFFLSLFFVFLAYQAFPVTVKGPDGDVLVAFLVLVMLPPFIYLFVRWIRNHKKNRQHPLRGEKKLVVTLEKNKPYFPDFIKLSVSNRGKKDIDIDKPMLIFSNFWVKRKFKLKGSHQYVFYPLILEPGKTHDLNIDMNHFYNHDPHLRRYSRVTVLVNEVNGRYAVSGSVMVRKTLFR